MSLDVVVVTYNSGRHLTDALAGIPPEATLTIVDNASRDDSIAVAARHGAAVVLNPVNAGFGAAANIGARRGHGELLLFLNPDARVTPDVVAELCRRMLDDPSVDVLSPRLRRPDGSEQRALWPYPSARGAWREALGLHRLRPDAAGNGFVIGACFLVRRSAFEAVGGFDERFWLYSEETDLCRRIEKRGGRIELADDLWAEHVGGASGRGVEGLVFEHFERGGDHVVAKHDGKPALLAYRLANLTGAAIRSFAPGPPERQRLHRARANRLLGRLARHPLTVRVESPATAAQGQSLVVCSLEPWDDVWRRNQFLVRELLARNPNRRVLFVEPPFDWVHELRRGSGRRRRRKLRPVEGDGRVVRVEPGKVAPRLLGDLADRSLRRQVRRAARRMGLRDPVLWVNDSAYAGLSTETGWPALYDITDDWTESGESGRAVERTRANEARLFEECASVVVCSVGLADSRRPAFPELMVVPNAVDVAHFQRPQPRPVDLPVAPTAVYVGTLHDDRIDVELVERLARAAPGMSVVLVGPSSLSDGSADRLATLPNVHLLGARPYDEVPAYLQHADVVIVPHVVTPFTESLDPIKAYECLAVGRPTVATPVAGFRDAGPPVQVSSGLGFVDAVLEASTPRQASAPAPVATWAQRAVSFEAALAAAEGGRRPLRVVFVDHCAKLSGAELALVSLLPALQEVGVEAHVILGEHGPLEERLAATGAVVEVLALDERVGATKRHEVSGGSVGLARVGAAARDVWRLRARVRELRPDLVHTNSLKAALYGGAAARLAGVPVVWHIRDRIADDYLPKPAVRLVRLLALVIPRVVIANSQATRATLGPLPRAGVIPSPVVYDAHQPVRRTHVDSPDEGLRVVLVGRIAPWKGQDVFLRAFAKAFAGGNERAVIVGSPMFGEEDFEEELHRLAEDLDIAEQVEFTGFVHDVASVLAQADCLVHASVIPEPFGQVVVEGMAASLPVIATREGGPGEIITSGVNGLLYDAGDFAALAGCLQLVARSPELRASLVAPGARRARDFLPEVVAWRVRDAYVTALTGHRR